MKKLRITLLAAAHLFMDMTTVAFVFVLVGVREFGAVPEGGGSSFYSQEIPWLIAVCMIVYDLIAFGAQPFLGAFIDIKKRAALLLYVSLFGAGIIAGICAFCDYPQGIHTFSVVLLVLFSLFNAAFHVSAAAFVIPESETKSAPLGIFVSLGAIGVALGRLYAPAVLFWAGIGCVAFAVSFLLLRVNGLSLAPYFGRTAMLCPQKEVDVLPLFLILFAIWVRGFGGTALSAEYSATPALILTAAFMAAAGKAVGGFLSDWIGVRAAVAVCLPLSAFLMFFGAGIPALYLAGMLLFNTSMPMTLWLSFWTMPRYKNAAFGICAAFLMLGSVAAMFTAIPAWIGFVLALCSAVSVFAVPYLLKNKKLLPVGRKEGKDGANA